jgi:hypothetical protein
MSLQSSGQISMGNIRTELGLLTSNFSLNSAELGTYVTINQNSASKPNGSNPNSISEWYGYDHDAGPLCVCYTIECTSRSASFDYDECDSGETTSIFILGVNSEDICAREGSVVLTGGSGTFSISISDCCSATTTTTTTTSTTTTTTAPPGCFSISLGFDKSTAFAACGALSGTYYTNTSTGAFTSDTNVIHTKSDCTTLAPDGYYADSFGQWKYWDGTSFGSSGFC